MKSFRPLINTITLMALFLCGANRLQAQGTAFTYQGRLNTGTNPANGIYDATFALFSVASGAGQVGTTQTNLATAVSNGFFAVTLDFGANFPGAGRWLEINVRTNGGGAFTTLSPRQKLTPTPYAITASNLTGNLPATQLSGTLPATQLGGTYNSVLTFNNAANSYTGSGAGLTGVNALTLGGLSASSFWKLLGNAGTTSNNFLGTTDNQPLELRVNNQRGLRLEQNGVGDVNVIGGNSNNIVVTGAGAFIGGGHFNSISGNNSTISGGEFNNAEGISLTIGGGSSNIISSPFIGGGAAGNYHTIAGGVSNSIHSVNNGYDEGNTIGGGIQNDIRYQTDGSTIGGGRHNAINSDSSNSTIGGGHDNFLDSPTGTIAGGIWQSH